MTRMTVTKIPALKDNFMYLIICNETKHAAIVDPVEPERVLKSAKESGVSLNKVLTTHHHWDHAGGNADLFKHYQMDTSLGPLSIYGGQDERIPNLTNPVGQDDTLNIGNLKVRCISTPCHTTSHICYYIETPEDKVVFTGDTLFLAGCGRFFEGTAQQMYDALITKLSALPDDTKVYCGHEYALNNLRFGNTIEPDNENISKLLAVAKEADLDGRRAMIPSTIGQEKLINVFMRVQKESVQFSIGKNTPLATMQALREAKDKF
ncbi:hydroxyacylglutathione hydrolase, mitochondrial isoform X2 [Malaya genurostris]|nr:hydroxyacylglutathione hydrolase, mitochondrial isoform X2 [Malaya genurostris]XP_058442963.1 hydroxyacylglutathione hydrolase, mitochondrial isoform X2 [Malaya genurostris]XP_058442964.1 hydroxyacylglutathione hydrolase, mitochondrial isoform X2 [Malaya genurostris]